MPHFVVVLCGLLLASLPGSFTQGQSVTDEQVIYVSSLLTAPTAQQVGYERYRRFDAVMNGIRYEHSVVTGVQNHTAPAQRYSWLTLQLDGKYERFQAMVGRDDKEHLLGPAYCRFEIYGDGVPLFRSEAIRSAVSPVVVDDISAPKRKVPQSVDISVKGVRTLRLVTRFADEFSQQARYVHRALGCVWGDARLTPLPGDQRSGQPGPDAWENIVRRAALRLTEGLMLSPRSDQMPYHVAMTPLRFGKAAIERGVLSATQESDLRTAILKRFCSIKHGDGTAFAEVSETDARAIADALGAESPLRSKPDVICSIGKGANADFLIFGAIEESGDSWSLSLRLVEMTKGETLRQVTTPVTFSPKE